MTGNDLAERQFIENTATLLSECNLILLFLNLSPQMTKATKTEKKIKKKNVFVKTHLDPTQRLVPLGLLEKWIWVNPGETAIHGV